MECGIIGNGNTTKFKCKIFAVRIVNLYKYLHNEKHEYVLTKQLLRSGTSIGANIAESECAISKREFLSKVYIALKECMETLYWLDLLYETQYLAKDQFNSIYADCEEMRKMTSSTTKTTSNSTLNTPHSKLNLTLNTPHQRSERAKIEFNIKKGGYHDVRAAVYVIVESRQSDC